MKLPPLSSLPVFEAVARLNSFSKAAEELNVSQSAISHQIKTLESYLGEILFLRNGRILTLTDEGKQYLESIGSALMQIERVTGSLLGGEESSLRLAVFSSFAVRWLVPRLSDFQRDHSQLQLRLEMTSEPPVLSDRTADCFISNTNQSPAFNYELLYREKLFPVCSRRFWSTICQDLGIEGQNSDNTTQLTAGQVSSYPLLSTHSIFERHTGDWQEWFQKVNEPIPSNTIVHHFSHMLLALEAARYHQGIALTNDYMLNDSYDAGEFVRIPSHAVLTGDRFYFAYKTSRRNEIGIRIVRNWLIAQAVKSELLLIDTNS